MNVSTAAGGHFLREGKVLRVIYSEICIYICSCEFSLRNFCDLRARAAFDWNKLDRFPSVEQKHNGIIQITHVWCEFSTCIGCFHRICLSPFSVIFLCIILIRPPRDFTRTWVLPFYTLRNIYSYPSVKIDISDISMFLSLHNFFISFFPMYVDDNFIPYLLFILTKDRLWWSKLINECRVQGQRIVNSDMRFKTLESRNQNWELRNQNRVVRRTSMIRTYNIFSQPA